MIDPGDIMFEEKVKESLKTLIADYVRATGLTKKEVNRIFVPAFNVMKFDWILIHKKNVCRHCGGDGQGRCEKVACVTGTQTEECPDCHNAEGRRIGAICEHCAGFGDMSQFNAFGGKTNPEFLRKMLGVIDQQKIVASARQAGKSVPNVVMAAGK